MTNQSIYSEHYEGTTYRTGVAYLRARSRTDPRPPRKVGRETLDQQREIVAQAARKEQTIIVAEFIDYGTPRGLRPGLEALLDFTTTTHVQNCYLVSRRHLTTRADETDFWDKHFQIAGIDRIYVDEE
jgi:DNA invertase Pin-like site-specific DNA recombinase